MKIHPDDRYEILISNVETYHIQGNLEKMEENMRELQHLAEEEQNDIGLAATYHYLAILSRYKGDPENGKIYIEKALAIEKEKNIPYYLMKSNNTRAIIYSGEADFHSSLNCYLASAHIAEEHPEYQFEAIVLNNMGNLFVWLNEYETAVEYLEQSYEKYWESGLDDPLLLETLVINIFELHSDLDEYEKVDFWRKNARVEFDALAQEVLDCIFLVNDFKIAAKAGEREKVAAVYEKFRVVAFSSNDFIYVFRCLMNVLKVCIDIDEAEIAADVLKRLEEKATESKMDTFQYDFSELKVHYYQKFLMKDCCEYHELFEEYFILSQQKLKQMKNTYARSLFAEIELDKSRHEIDTVANENKQLQKDLERDIFTNLYNKVSIENYVREELANRTGKHKHALMLIDIDLFKNVNDYYGHDFGDKVIWEVSRILEDIQQEEKLIGRFGGDEFMVFLKDVKDAEAVENVCKEYLRKTSNIKIPDDRIPCITLSIGVRIVEGQTSFEQIFKESDLALYKAKERGRKQFVFYADLAREVFEM